MAVDPLPEAATVTVFMEGLRTGVARTEVFRTHPTSFEEAVNVALNAEFNFKSSRLGRNASYANPSSVPEPMDLSYAEDEEAGLLAAEQLPVGAGRPTGEELSSVESHGGGGQQGLAPKGAVLSNTERVCKPGLLVVQATVKGFDKPWTILVETGASGNYARRSTMEGSQLYAEALKARNRDIVTVRLATGTRVSVPKVPGDLGVKFLDFDSVERCLVLDLNARYDLILGMAWLEHHEPWIDWRSKTLGATHFSPSGALATASLHAHEGMVGSEPRHHVCRPYDARGVAQNPLSEARIDDEPSLGAKDGMVGVMPKTQGRSPAVECGVAHNPLSGGCGQSSTSLSVGRDTEAPSELEEVMTPKGAAGAHTKASRRRTTSTKRRRRRKMLAARRMASEMSRDVNGVVSGTALHDSEQLYTLVNGVTGDVDGDVNLGAVSTLAALLELDEKSFDVFGEALQAGELAEVVVRRPEEELNASSLLDEAVLEDAKKALNARSGSEILKNPSDPFYPVIKEYQDVTSKEPPSGLPPDRGVRHEIDLVPGTKYCVTRQWPLPREQCDVIDAFFRAKYEAGLVRESKSPHSTPTFGVRKPNGKWRIVHAFNKLNAATIPAQTPIPRKDDLQNNMAGCTLYCALDLVDGLLYAPILALPDPDRRFSVVWDVSDFAIGCALIQADAEGRERVIAFESRHLKAAEKNYRVHDKELLAQKYALVKFRVHLLGSKPFVIYTDHASLRTATRSPHLSQRMARWLSFFAEYIFEVKFKPGKHNALADALSRRPDYELAHVTTVTSSIPDLLRASYASDDMCVALMKALGSKAFEDSDKELLARLRARLHRYAFDGGLLYYSTGSDDPPRVVVPHDEDLKYRILYEAQDTPVGDHLEREKTYSSVSLHYW
ncbi:unnamed protein product [Phytophthora fragariaefolia]|uniref:RNA-directed DNA polymerase n=1 Tax=Phytophthora fragariaefolia TaxID=1490495 RepID=A0A9W6Y083_9STRA|nr:unnamed protein product [Phytophthora fragariaefolia]